MCKIFKIETFLLEQDNPVEKTKFNNKKVNTIFFEQPFDNVIYVRPCFVTPIESNAKLSIDNTCEQCIIRVATNWIWKFKSCDNIGRIITYLYFDNFMFNWCPLFIKPWEWSSCFLALDLVLQQSLWWIRVHQRWFCNVRTTVQELFNITPFCYWKSTNNYREIGAQFW